MVCIEREAEDFLSVKEQEAVAKQIFGLISENSMQINGKQIELNWTGCSLALISEILP